MAALSFYTVDVFTKARFGGNPLAVVFGGEALGSATMQAIAAEFNYSETTFILAPANPANTARIRIFNRTAEMAFAGHPMVGTAFVLANKHPALIDASFEVPAGIVRVKIERDVDGKPLGASIDTPQPLSIGKTVTPEIIARVLQLAPDDLVTTHHEPISASNGTAFIIAEIRPEALTLCSPDLPAFREALAAHPHFGNRFSVHVYSRSNEMIRARMFAPLSGTWEDPATGSANTALACLLLFLDPDAREASFQVHQGVEMGRSSHLLVDARRTSEGIVATVRGSCVAVMQGEIQS